MTNPANEVQDVQPKTESVPAQLRGVPGPNFSYSVCIVDNADVKEDGDFTTSKFIQFANVDQAVAGLENLLAHAKQYQMQRELSNAFNAGVEAANMKRAAEEAQPEAAPAEVPAQTFRMAEEQPAEPEAPVEQPQN